MQDIGRMSPPTARQRRSKAAAVSRALGVAALLLAGCGNVRIDEQTVFRPQSRMAPAETVAEMERWPAAELHAEYDELRVQHGFVGDGGERIAYTHLKRGGTNRPLVVVCGGNAADRYNSGPAYARRVLADADVLLFDYPGYGDSAGAPSAEALTRAARQVAALAAQLRGERPLIYWGQSLGGFVCSTMAGASPDADGVVLETTARSAAEVAAAWTPWYAAPFVSVEVADSLAAYDVAGALRGFRGPILVLGARRDDTLPVELSRSLHAALQAQGARATYVELRVAGHNDAPSDPAFAPAVQGFFSGF